MRSSLENIEFVETFLCLEPRAKAFDEMKRTINNSEELSALREFQEMLILSSKRTALKKEIERYTGKDGGSFSNRFSLILLIGLSIIGGIALILTLFSQKPIENHDSTKTIKAYPPTEPFGTSSAINDEQVVNAKDAVYQSSQQTSLSTSEGLSPWVPFKKQHFMFNAQNGATLEGEDGTLIVIPKNALIDKNNHPIKGMVDAELIEAIDWEDMIAYNLTTMNGDKALSSGGMVHIQFTQNGTKLSIDQTLPLHIEIPTDNYNPEMMAWEGIPGNGKLDWQNPTPLKKYLTEVPLELLDFLPPGFENEVETLLPYKNHSTLTPQLVDSLYYAILIDDIEKEAPMPFQSDFQASCFFKVAKRKDLSGQPKGQLTAYLKGKGTVTARIVDEQGLPIPGMKVKLYMDNYLENEEVVTTDKNGYFTYDRLYAGNVTINASLSSSGFTTTPWKYCAVSEFEFPARTKKLVIEKPIIANYSSQLNNALFTVSSRKTGGCFIDPMGIKALKTAGFQHSFIATKEFEERLKVMHSSKNGSVLLDVYLQNLTKNLWECDQLASELVTGQEKAQFQAFAKQRLTTVEHQAIYQDKITRYYTEKRKEFREAQRKRSADYQSKSMEELTKLRDQINSLQTNGSALATTFAAQKRGLNRISKSSQRDPIIPQNLSTQNRNVAMTPTYKVSWYSSAWINIDCYLKELGTSPWIASISVDRNSNQLNVYQCIRELKTLVGLNRLNDSYNAHFPQKSTSLETYCLAIDKKGDQLFFDSKRYTPTAHSNVSLLLRPISYDSLYSAICNLSPETSCLAQQLQETEARLAIELRIRKQQGILEEQLKAKTDELSIENTRYNQLYDVINKCPTDNRAEQVQEVLQRSNLPQVNPK